MKKRLLLLILLLLPIIVMAENVSIKSVKLVEKDTYVEEVGKPKFDGLKVDFDLKFENLGDKATYLFEIENKDNENYFMDLKVSSTSKYILYTLDSDESTNVVKANSSTKVYVIIKYNEEVPSYKLTNNKYTEKESIKVSLTNNKGEEVITESTAKNSVIVVNPNTGNIVLRIKNTNIVVSLYTVIIVLLIAIVAIIVLKKLKVKRYTSMILVLGMILIPGMVSAIKTINIEINSNIEIEPVELIDFKFAFMDMLNEKSKTKSYKASKGMTFGEWENSKYNVDGISFNKEINQGKCVPGYYVNAVVHYNDPVSNGATSSNYFASLGYTDINSFDEEIEGYTYLVIYTDCTISFELKINNQLKVYNAEYDMTFDEWLESEYNVDHISYELGEYECDKNKPYSTSEVIETIEYELIGNRICPIVVR